ncbi:MAG: MBL fold metallo-hydrolase [Candidatus Bathyarchaeota archaeon]|nr:MBL fold metallo-hydrolase [Candidatus Bathyarchaeota archaeon]
MEVYSKTGQFDDNIFYIDTLAHNMKKSIGVLVYKNVNECVIFDSGMPNCTNQILRSLKSLRIEQESICHILLTHRHIDHAGASADLLKQFSKAKVGIHPFSIRHLFDPLKIYQGGRELFGEFAMPMKPIQFSSMIALEDNQEIRIGHNVVKAIYSPGHTSDHISYYIPSKKTLYCGDVIGSFNPEIEKIHPTSIFPSFNYVKYKQTIEKIRSLDIETMVFSHFGVAIGKDVKKNLDNSLATHKELESIVESYTDKPDNMKLIQDLKNTLEDATEIFPAPVRERAAEFMARGFMKGMNSK